VQPVERVYRVWVVPVEGVGGMDAVVKPTGRYLRRPLTGTTQTYRSDEWPTGYTSHWQRRRRFASGSQPNSSITLNTSVSDTTPIGSSFSATATRRMLCSVTDLSNKRVGECTGGNGVSPFHLAGKIIGDGFFTDNFRISRIDEVGRFLPANIFQHHRTREQ
jgi:hypothetical protein